MGLTPVLQAFVSGEVMSILQIRLRHREAKTHAQVSLRWVLAPLLPPDPQFSHSPELPPLVQESGEESGTGVTAGEAVTSHCVWQVTMGCLQPRGLPSAGLLPLPAQALLGHLSHQVVPQHSSLTTDPFGKPRDGT